MHVDELLTRAREAAARGIAYKLGKGGMSGTSSLPCDANGQCDCSGYACWCLGISRQTSHPLYVKFNGGWINTDAIVHDANSDTGFFSRLDQPEPGAFIVYPSPQAGKVGHVGIVTEVADVGGVTKPTRVIHCSHGNYAQTGDAVRETGPDVFLLQSTTIFAWYEGVESAV